MAKLELWCLLWCVALSGTSPAPNGTANNNINDDKTRGTEELDEDYIETLGSETDNQENILSQLLGDYDKVKAVSEGSDCQCKCVVRPLSRNACRRIEEGTTKAQDFYTVETVTSGPGCKCACIAPPSALNPCEGDFRLKKLQEAEAQNIKLSTIIDLLEGAFYGMDLLKIHSVTTKLVDRIDRIEKAVSVNNTKEKQSAKRDFDGQTQIKENQSLHRIEKKKRLNNLALALQRDAAAAYTHTEKKYEERFINDREFTKPHLKRSHTELPTLAQQIREPQQTNAMGKSAIIRGITYYKANNVEEDTDTDEQPEDESLSGDGPTDLLFEEQLIKQTSNPARSNSRPEPMAGPPTPTSSESETTQNSQSTKSATDPATEESTTAATVSSGVVPSFTMTAPKFTTQETTVKHTRTTQQSPAIATTVPETTISQGTTTIATTTSTTTASTTTASTTTASTTTASSTTTSTTTTTAKPTTSETDSVTVPNLTTTRAPLQKTITPATVPQIKTAGPSPGVKPRQPFRLDEVVSQENMGDEAQKNGVCKDTLSTISDPVTHNTYGRSEGAWMKDPKASDDRIYVTNYYYGNNLLEFRTMENFKQGRWTNSYKLPYNWIGTGHVVYNGAFFYNRAFSRDIIKFDLKQRYVAAWTMLHDAVFEEETPWRWRGHSDIDFAVDENGLWVIYPAIDDEGFHEEVIILSKLNAVDLSIQKETTWRTGLRKNFYGNCFIVCGVLYAVDSYNKMNANISYAFDTHTNTQMIPRLPFLNNYTYTTQIDYNPKDRVLYAWDNGHQVTYAVIFAY
uniref:Olfactomedin like 2B n=1 Tax=Lepisosteus oculatus TaxID=7918 RepID=W5LZ58_LEPOC|nr:PREDICTED: olfactomedin-like protein 2B isoform X1 [Lepisosteus oculatus]